MNNRGKKKQSDDLVVSSSMAAIAAAIAAMSAHASSSMPAIDFMQVDPESLTENIPIDSFIQTNSFLSQFGGVYSEVFTTELSRFFSTSDKAHLATSCRHFYSIFNPELKQLAIDKLLTHVIRGEQVEAEKMIKSNPRLLLETGTVTDYSGRKIEGTALQLALGAEDVKYHDDEECMVEMIHKYLRTLPDGEAIISEQTTQQFPEGWEFKEKQRVIRDSDVLNAVINTIANSTNPADWEKAIHTLRNYLESENKSKPIQTGKHFNHQLLVEALKLYNQNYDRCGGCNNAKNNAVWLRVIGTIERYVSAATAQALCTGVGTMVDKKGKLKRSLNLRNHDYARAMSYFPLDNNSTSILGRDFAVYSYYGQGTGGRCGVVGGAGEDGAIALQELSQTKTSNLQRLCSAHGPGQNTRPRVV